MEKLLFLVFYCLCATKCIIADEMEKHYRFEYKHSFKGPHLMQPDQTVAFWNLMGDVVPADEKLRLVPSIHDKKGLAWSKFPFPFEGWEIQVHFRIEGRGKVGADGMAVWYTTSAGELGPVFGSNDYFNGVGIILDSFDNDNRMNNPNIYVIVNDGTKAFDHANDGIDQSSGGCLCDFRNRPFPVKLKIMYYKGRLDVLYTPGYFDQEEFQLCTTVFVELPTNNYFGVSAATGGLADDHDVLKFLTWSVADKKIEEGGDAVDDVGERERLQKEYEQNLEDFNKMHDDYRKEHPDDATNERGSPEQLFEGNASPELSSIFDIQSNINRDIRHLSDNMQILIDQQLSMSNVLNEIREQRGSLGSQSDAPAAGADDNAKRYHVDNLLNMQRESYDAVKQVRDTLSGLVHTMNNVDIKIQQQASKPSTGVGDSYEALQQRQNMLRNLDSLQNDINALLHRQPSAPKLVCPEPEMPSCVSLGIFVFIAIVQIVILLIYHSMKASREEAAKKFF